MAVSAFALSLSLSGCVFEEDDEDFGRILVTWSLETTDGAGVTCEPDEIVRVTVDSIVEDFDCEIGSAITEALPEGTFFVTFELVGIEGLMSTVTFPVTLADGQTTDAGHVVFVVASF